MRPDNVSFAPAVKLLDQCLVQPFRVPQTHVVPDGPSFVSSLAAAAEAGVEIVHASGLHLMILQSMCLLTAVTTVHLSNNCLVALPDDFASSLPNCETLTLNQNEFKSFPAQVLQMRSLTSLNMQDNELRSVPSSIGQLSRLASLFLGNCKLGSLPVSLGSLTDLRVLHLQSNCFKSMPSSIGNFVKLQSLYLHNNLLTSLPGNIGSMTSLAVLTLQSNDISTLPASMQRLTSLWSLNVSQNALTDLPRLPASVTAFIYAGNRFTGIAGYDKDGTGPSWLLKYSRNRTSTVIEVAVSSMQMDFAGLVMDGKGDVEFMLASGERLLAYGAILKTRMHRIRCDELFETPQPLSTNDGRWAWPVKPIVPFSLLVGIVEFLYSGLRERCDMTEPLCERIFATADPAKDEEQFFEDMKHLQDQTEYSDLTLEAVGENGLRVQLPVHKFVLTSRCTPMERMLGSESVFREASQKVVQLSESEEVLRAVLQFLYEDRVDLEGDTVEGVLSAAMKWGLPRLANLAESFIVEALDRDVLFSVFHLADVLDAGQLKSICKSEIQKLGATVIARSEDFQNLPLALQSELVFEASQNGAPSYNYRTPIAKKSVRSTHHDLEYRDIAELPVCRMALEIIEYRIKHPADPVERFVRRQAKKLLKRRATPGELVTFFEPAMEWLRLALPRSLLTNPSVEKLAAVMLKIADWLSRMTEVAKIVKEVHGIGYERRTPLQLTGPVQYLSAMPGEAQMNTISNWREQIGALMNNLNVSPLHFPDQIGEMKISEFVSWVKSVSEDPFWLQFVADFPVDLTPKTLFELEANLAPNHSDDVWVNAVIAEMSQFALVWPPPKHGDAALYHAYIQLVSVVSFFVWFLFILFSLASKQSSPSAGRTEVKDREAIYAQCMDSVTWQSFGRDVIVMNGGGGSNVLMPSEDDATESDSHPFSFTAQPFLFDNGVPSIGLETSGANSSSQEGESLEFSFTPSPGPGDDSARQSPSPSDVAASTNSFQSASCLAASRKRSVPNRRLQMKKT